MEAYRFGEIEAEELQLVAFCVFAQSPRERHQQNHGYGLGPWVSSINKDTGLNPREPAKLLSAKT